MVFLMTKAAIIAAIITILGLFFANEMRRGRPRTIFTNPRTPPDSSVTCNCQLITSCLSSLKINETPRFCGFEGIQRKICCDPEAEGGAVAGVEGQTDARTNAFLTTAQIQSQAAKFYRNQFLYNNERIRGSGWTEQSTSTTRRPTPRTDPTTPKVRPSSRRPLTSTTTRASFTTTIKTTPRPTMTSAPDPPSTPSTILTTISSSISPTELTEPESDTEKPKENRKLPSDSDQLDEESLAKLQKDAGSFLAEFFPDYYADLVKNLTQLDNVTFIEDIPVPKDKTTDGNNYDENLNETENPLKRLFEGQDEYYSTTQKGEGGGTSQEIDFDTFDFEQFLNISGLLTTTTPTPSPLSSTIESSGDGESGNRTSTDISDALADNSTESDGGKSGDNVSNGDLDDPKSINTSDSVGDGYLYPVPETTTMSQFEPGLSPSSSTLSSGAEEKVTDIPAQVPTVSMSSDITTTPEYNSEPVMEGQNEGQGQNDFDLEVSTLRSITSVSSSISSEQTPVKQFEIGDELTTIINPMSDQKYHPTTTPVSNDQSTSPQLFLTSLNYDMTSTPGNPPNSEDSEITTISSHSPENFGISNSQNVTESSIDSTSQGVPSDLLITTPKSESPLEGTTSQTPPKTMGIDPSESNSDFDTTTPASFSLDHEYPAKGENSTGETSTSPPLDLTLGHDLTSTDSTPTSIISSTSTTEKRGETTQSDLNRDDPFLDNPVVTTTQSSTSLEISHSSDKPEVSEMSTTTSGVISSTDEMTTTGSPLMDETSKNTTSEDILGPTQMSSVDPTGQSLLHQKGDGDVQDHDHNEVGGGYLDLESERSNGTVDNESPSTETPTTTPHSSSVPSTSTMEPLPASESNAEIETTTISGVEVIGKNETNLSEDGQLTTTEGSHQPDPEVTTMTSILQDTTLSGESFAPNAVNEDKEEDMISTTELSPLPNKTNGDLDQNSETDEIDLLNKEVMKALDEGEVTTVTPNPTEVPGSSTTISSNPDKSTTTTSISSQSETTTPGRDEDEQRTTQIPQLPSTERSPSTTSRSKDLNQQSLPYTEIMDHTTTESSNSVPEVNEGHTEPGQDPESKATTTVKSTELENDSTSTPTSQISPNVEGDSEQNENDVQPSATTMPTFSTNTVTSSTMDSKDLPSPTTESGNEFGKNDGMVEITTIAPDIIISTSTPSITANASTNLLDKNIQITTQNIESVPESTQRPEEINENNNEALFPTSTTQSHISEGITVPSNTQHDDDPITTTGMPMIKETSTFRAMGVTDSNDQGHGRGQSHIEDEVTTESVMGTSTPVVGISGDPSSTTTASNDPVEVITTPQSDLEISDTEVTSTPKPASTTKAPSQLSPEDVEPIDVTTQKSHSTKIDDLLKDGEEDANEISDEDKAVEEKPRESSSSSVSPPSSEVNVDLNSDLTTTPESLPEITTKPVESLLLKSGIDTPTTIRNMDSENESETVGSTPSNFSPSATEQPTTPTTGTKASEDTSAFSTTSTTTTSQTTIEDLITTTEGVKGQDDESNGESETTVNSTQSKGEPSDSEVTTVSSDFKSEGSTTPTSKSTQETTQSSLIDDITTTMAAFITSIKQLTSTSVKPDSTESPTSTPSSGLDDQYTASTTSPDTPSSSSKSRDEMDPTTQVPDKELSVTTPKTADLIPTTQSPSSDDAAVQINSNAGESTTTPEADDMAFTTTDGTRGADLPKNLEADSVPTSIPRDEPFDLEATTGTSDSKAGTPSTSTSRAKIDETTQSLPTDDSATEISTFTTKKPSTSSTPDGLTDSTESLIITTPSGMTSEGSMSRDEIETTTQILENEFGLKASTETGGLIPTTQSTALDIDEESGRIGEDKITTEQGSPIFSAGESTPRPVDEISFTTTEGTHSKDLAKDKLDDTLPTTIPTIENTKLTAVTSTTTESPPTTSKDGVDLATEIGTNEENVDHQTTENLPATTPVVKSEMSSSTTTESSSASNSDTTLTPETEKDQTRDDNAFTTTEMSMARDNEPKLATTIPGMSSETSIFTTTTESVQKVQMVSDDKLESTTEGKTSQGQEGPLEKDTTESEIDDAELPTTTGSSHSHSDTSSSTTVSTTNVDNDSDNEIDTPVKTSEDVSPSGTEQPTHSSKTATSEETSASSVTTTTTTPQITIDDLVTTTEGVKGQDSESDGKSETTVTPTYPKEGHTESEIGDAELPTTTGSSLSHSDKISSTTIITPTTNKITDSDNEVETIVTTSADVSPFATELPTTSRTSPTEDISAFSNTTTTSTTFKTVIEDLVTTTEGVKGQDGESGTTQSKEEISDSDVTTASSDPNSETSSKLAQETTQSSLMDEITSTMAAIITSIKQLTSTSVDTPDSTELPTTTPNSGEDDKRTSSTASPDTSSLGSKSRDGMDTTTQATGNEFSLTTSKETPDLIPTTQTPSSDDREAKINPNAGESTTTPKVDEAAFTTTDGTGRPDLPKDPSDEDDSVPTTNPTILNNLPTFSSTTTEPNYTTDRDESTTVGGTNQGTVENQSMENLPSTLAPTPAPDTSSSSTTASLDSETTQPPEVEKGQDENNNDFPTSEMSTSPNLVREDEPQSPTMIPGTSSESPTFTTSAESTQKSQMMSDDKIESTTETSTNQGREKDTTESESGDNELPTTTESSLSHSDKISSTIITPTTNKNTINDNEDETVVTTSGDVSSSATEQPTTLSSKTSTSEETSALSTTTTPQTIIEDLVTTTEGVKGQEGEPDKEDETTVTPTHSKKESSDSEATTASSDSKSETSTTPTSKSTQETTQHSLIDDVPTTMASGASHSDTSGSTTAVTTPVQGMGHGLEEELDSLTTTQGPATPINSEISEDLPDTQDAAITTEGSIFTNSERSSSSSSTSESGETETSTSSASESSRDGGMRNLNIPDQPEITTTREDSEGETTTNRISSSSTSTTAPTTITITPKSPISSDPEMTTPEETPDSVQDATEPSTFSTTPTTGDAVSSVFEQAGIVKSTTTDSKTIQDGNDGLPTTTSSNDETSATESTKIGGIPDERVEMNLDDFTTTQDNLVDSGNKPTTPISTIEDTTSEVSATEILQPTSTDGVRNDADITTENTLRRDNVDDVREIITSTPKTADKSLEKSEQDLTTTTTPSTVGRTSGKPITTTTADETNDVVNDDTITTLSPSGESLLSSKEPESSTVISTTGESLMSSTMSTNAPFDDVKSSTDRIPMVLDSTEKSQETTITTTSSNQSENEDLSTSTGKPGQISQSTTSSSTVPSIPMTTDPASLKDVDKVTSEVGITPTTIPETSTEISQMSQDSNEKSQKTITPTASTSTGNDSESPTTVSGSTSETTASSTVSPSISFITESTSGANPEVGPTTPSSYPESEVTTTLLSTIDEKVEQPTTETPQSQVKHQDKMANDVDTIVTTTPESSTDLDKTTISNFKSGMDMPPTTSPSLTSTKPSSFPDSTESSTQPTGGEGTTESQQLDNGESSTQLPTTSDIPMSMSEVDMKTENISDLLSSSTFEPTTMLNNEVEFSTTSSSTDAKSQITSTTPNTIVPSKMDGTTTASTILDESTITSHRIMEDDVSVTTTVKGVTEDVIISTTVAPLSENDSTNDTQTVEKLNEEIMEKLDYMDLGLNMSSTTESSSTDNYLKTPPTSSPEMIDSTTMFGLDFEGTTGSESYPSTTSRDTLELSTVKSLISDEYLENSTEVVKIQPPPSFMLNITEIFPEPGATPGEPKTSVTSSKSELKTTSTKSSTFSPITVLQGMKAADSTSTMASVMDGDENTEKDSSIDFTTQLPSTVEIASSNKTNETGAIPPGLNDLEFVPDYPEQFNQNDSSETDVDTTTRNATEISTDFTTELPKKPGIVETVSKVNPIPRKLSDRVTTTPSEIEDEMSTTSTSTSVTQLSEQNDGTMSSVSSESISTTPETRTTTDDSSPTTITPSSESPSSKNSSDNPQTIVSFIVSVSATRSQSSKSKTFTETTTHNVTYHLSLNHTTAPISATIVKSESYESNSNSTTSSPNDEAVFDESTSTPNSTLDATTVFLEIGPETTTPVMDESTTTHAPSETSTIGMIVVDSLNVNPEDGNVTRTTTEKQSLDMTSTTPTMEESMNDELVFDDKTTTSLSTHDMQGTTVDYENVTETTTSSKLLANSSTMPTTEETSTIATLVEFSTENNNFVPENISVIVTDDHLLLPQDNKTSRNLEFTPTETTTIKPEPKTTTEPMVQEMTQENITAIMETTEAPLPTESSISVLSSTEKVLPTNSTTSPPVSDVGSDFADLFTSNSRSNPNSSLILDIITRPPLSLSPNSTTTTSGESRPSNKTEEEISLIISTGRGNRSLTNPEAIHLAKELGSQISNVVNQLLLTTHKKFHLLPLFTECANAKRPRKTFRALNLEYEHLSHVVRIGAMEKGGLVFGCAGTLISKRYVLSSAYCLQNKYPITTILLEDEQSNKRYVDIESIILHPQFSNQTHENDIALIRLKDEQTGIKPICLPFEDAYGIWESIHQSPGDSAMLSGWTKKVKRSREVDLRETEVNIVPEVNCTSLFKPKSSSDLSSQICTTSPIIFPNYFTRGSPLTTVMTRHKLYFQIGILSNYNTNAQLYTRITTYLQWILDSIEE